MQNCPLSVFLKQKSAILMIWAWKCSSCDYLDLKYIVGVLHSGVLKALEP